MLNKLRQTGLILLTGFIALTAIGGGVGLVSGRGSNPFPVGGRGGPPFSA